MPASGTALTYRLITVSKLQDRTVTVGQIYTYVIATSDGAAAEGTIKPVALIYGCAADAGVDKDCGAAMKAPGAKRDGDLVTVPVPADIADGLAKQSALQYRSFIVERRKIAMPGPKDPKAADAGEFGPDPVFVLSVGLECDSAAVQGFLPFGRVPQASFPCKQVVSRQSGPGSSLSPFDSTHTVTIELTDGGAGHATVPAGEFEVRNFTLKETSSDPSPAVALGDIAFSVKLGVAVKTHATVTARAAVVVTNDSELIAVSP